MIIDLVRHLLQLCLTNFLASVFHQRITCFLIFSILNSSKFNSENHTDILKQVISYPSISKLGIDKARMYTHLLQIKDFNKANFILALFNAYYDDENKLVCIIIKCPKLIYLIPQIQDLYPTAKFIHILRDGREFLTQRKNLDHQLVLLWIKILFTQPTNGKKKILITEKFSNHIITIKY